MSSVPSQVKPELSDPLKTKSTLTYTALKDVRLALDTKGIEVGRLIEAVRLPGGMGVGGRGPPWKSRYYQWVTNKTAWT